MPSSSRSHPSSRACGSIVRSVRRMSCATGTRFRRPVARSITGRLEPVAGGEPLVLAREDAVVGRDLHALVVLLGVELHERLAEGRERHGVLDARDRVADPDLDRAEARMQADVPPDVRVVGDAARLLELPDDLRVVGVVAEARRRARSAGTRRRPSAGSRRGRSARRARTASSRTSASSCERWTSSPFDDLDRLLRVVHRDVDVQAEDQLAARDVLELVDEVPVAVARRDPLALEEAERVRPGRADAQPLVARDLADEAAQLAQLGVDVGRRPGRPASRSRAPTASAPR